MNHLKRNEFTLTLLVIPICNFFRWIRIRYDNIQIQQNSTHPNPRTQLRKTPVVLQSRACKTERSGRHSLARLQWTCRICNGTSRTRSCLCFQKKKQVKRTPRESFAEGNGRREVSLRSQRAHALNMKNHETSVLEFTTTYTAIACSCLLYIWVLFFAHIPLVVNRTFNATKRLQQHPLLFTTNRTDRTFFLWRFHTARPPHPGHSTVLLRSKSPSGMCAKLRTVAVSNNRDHTPKSLCQCLFVPLIYWCCSSRTSRSRWIAHSTQRRRRDCNIRSELVL